MNSSELFAFYKKNIAHSICEEELNAKMHHCLPILFECFEILANPLKDFNHVVIETNLKRYEVATELVKAIGAYYEFILNTLKTHELDEKYVNDICMIYYNDALFEFPKYSRQMRAAFGF